MFVGINGLLISAIGVLLVLYLLRRRTRIIKAKLQGYFDAWLGTQAVSRLPVAEDHTATFTATGRPKVLVVDDEPSIRDLLVRALALADYDVDAASDGLEAVERVRGGGYNLLITDINMPGNDGLLHIKEARRLDATLPVIVITGHSTEATAIEAANLGVSGYFTKPFKAAQMLEATARALGE